VATEARTGLRRETLLRQVPDFRLYWKPGGKGDVANKAIKSAFGWDKTFDNRIDQLIEWGKLTLVVNAPATEKPKQKSVSEQMDEAKGRGRF
jgi:hypothetical protein